MFINGLSYISLRASSLKFWCQYSGMISSSKRFNSANDIKKEFRTIHAQFHVDFSLPSYCLILCQASSGKPLREILQAQGVAVLNTRMRGIE